MKQATGISRIAHFLTTAIFFFFLFTLFHGKVLLTYIPSGDDLFLITEVPRNWSELAFRFTDFSVNYRPLSRLTFGLYRLLEPHFTLIFFIHLFIVSLVTGLLYRNVRRFLDRTQAICLSTVMIFSPVFYYHIFTTSGLYNLSILTTHLILLLLVNFDRQNSRDFPLSVTKVRLAFFIFCLSIFLKESFLINTILFSMIAWQNLSHRKLWLALAACWGLTLGYVLARFYLFVPESAGSVYRFVFTLEKLKENVLLIGSWLLNYPRGWQYGAPLPKNGLTIGVTLATLIFFLGAVKLLLTKRTYLIFFGLLLAAALTPFLFLNRILLYYFDSAVLITVIAAAYGLSLYKNQKIINALVTLFVATFFVHYAVISPQWHQYSFVANANEAAHNFLEAIGTVDWHQKERLCVTNHDGGMWATQYGNLINHLGDKQLEVISVVDETLPESCQQNSLILKNDARKYEVVGEN